MGLCFVVFDDCGTPTILISFIFRLIHFLLEVDRRVPGISTFGGLVIRYYARLDAREVVESELFFC